VAPHVSEYFDHVIPENPALRGFLHKLHLDRYSPFDETFFFDADVLVFRPLNQVVQLWRSRAYTACGEYADAGLSDFGLNRSDVLAKIGHPTLVCIDGAGHAYFEKPSCSDVFDLAREIAANYEGYAGKIGFADEDVMNIAMTILGLEPMSRAGIWSRYCTGKKGTVNMDASVGMCSLEDADTGQTVQPYMMHFAANEAPLSYFRQLQRLFVKFQVPMTGLVAMTTKDFYLREIRWPAGRYVRSILKPFNSLK
jgi:hypothetical protein